MDIKQLNVINSLLGEDFLQKTEVAGILKLNTMTVVPLEEIKIALQIVPRAVLTWLYHNLMPLKVGGIWDSKIPFGDAEIHVNKLSPDNYSGQIIRTGKIAAKFEYRSLPGIGLIILSTLELYDMDKLEEIKPKDCKCNEAVKLQDMIDERIRLNSLIENVVTQKLAMQDAIKEMINYKINQQLFMKEELKIDEVAEKKSKLRAFLDKVHQPSEPEFAKKEIHCPDCGDALYKSGDRIKLCICYGEFQDKEIKIQKNEDGSIKMKFPKNFDPENIKMLLESLKNRG
jgi:hypothetical protein